MSIMKTQAAASLFAVAFLVGGNAWAGRYVVVNGQQMTLSQIEYMDQVNCIRVPNGAYWVDEQSGQWGYEGSGAMGYVGDHCSRRRPSLSERGMLYRPGELLSY